MRMHISTHRPNRTLWIVALILFVWGVLPLPYAGLAIILSAALLLLATSLLS
ncbi:MAG: hypothetical protein HY257_05850 [Chloroflexi bacterium]|nr:hypothetical protein [Chloroflexota bacterium]